MEKLQSAARAKPGYLLPAVALAGFLAGCALKAALAHTAGGDHP
jgi:hypothetical protein